MARRAAQPSPKRTNRGSLKKGFETRGPQTAPTGFVTTELGMNRKAMIRIKDHAQIVCTILMDAYVQRQHRQYSRSGVTYHRWRVTGRTVAEIHHPRMRRATPHKMKGRNLRYCSRFLSLSASISSSSRAGKTAGSVIGARCLESEWSDDCECDFFSLMSGSAVAGVWTTAGVAGVEVGSVDIARGAVYRVGLEPVTGWGNGGGTEERIARRAAGLVRKGNRSCVGRSTLSSGLASWLDVRPAWKRGHA